MTSDPGYGFVPLPPDVRRIARPEACWDRRAAGTLSGTLDIALTAQQPIHIGAGSKYARPPHVVLRGARVRGRPGVPGSSLKGVLRVRYEAITRSCAPLHPDDRDVRIHSSTGVQWARLTSAALRSDVFDDRGCSPTRMCPACALFGRMSLRSRITVTDLACAGRLEFAPDVLPERFGPNLHHVGRYRRSASGDRFEVHGLDGRKFHGGRGPAAEALQHVEAIPAGAVLTGQIRLFNATPAELGGLLAALGCDPASALKLGGGKAHGFGRAQCHVRCTLAAAGPAPLDPARWRQSLLESPDHWPEGERQLVALHRGGR